MEIWEMLLGIFIVLYQQGFSLCTRCLWDEFCISCPSVVCSTPSFQTRSSACILCAKVRVEAIKIKKLLHKRYRMSRSRFSPFGDTLFVSQMMPRVAPWTHVLMSPRLPLASRSPTGTARTPRCPLRPSAPTHTRGFQVAVTHVSVCKYI